MNYVHKSSPYRPSNLGAFDRTTNMLIVQHNFPNKYNSDKGDKMISEYHDRLVERDINRTHACFKYHTGTGPLGLEHWLKEANPKNVLEFLVDVMQAPGAKGFWTGYRVTGGVNLATGYPVFELTLFHNATGVKTYSGNKAPNVKEEASPSKMRRIRLGDIDW